MFLEVLDSTITALAIPIWFHLGLRVVKILVDTAVFHRRWANARGDQ